VELASEVRERRSLPVRDHGVGHEAQLVARELEPPEELYVVAARRVAVVESAELAEQRATQSAVRAVRVREEPRPDLQVRRQLAPGPHITRGVEPHALEAAADRVASARGAPHPRP